MTQLDRNRVAVDIEIREGKAAKIKELNILGNHAFTDKEIRNGFESSTTNWMSWYSKDDQYSREKLSGDLEKLQSYYMDRGYADFGVDSTQVTIAPDKRAMYIDASVKEGEIYKVSDVKLLGDLILPEETMRQLVFVKAATPSIAARSRRAPRRSRPCWPISAMPTPRSRRSRSWTRTSAPST